MFLYCSFNPTPDFKARVCQWWYRNPENLTQYIKFFNKPFLMLLISNISLSVLLFSLLRSA